MTETQIKALADLADTVASWQSADFADFLRTDQEQFLVQWECMSILYDGYLSDVARNTVQGNDLASEDEKPVATA
jgi:hypothetical protein